MRVLPGPSAVRLKSAARELWILLIASIPTTYLWLIALGLSERPSPAIVSPAVVS